MQLAGFDIAIKFCKKHRDASVWFARFRTAVLAASWQSIVDVRKDFPHADPVKLKSNTLVIVFNVKGNEYRMVTLVAYTLQALEILEVMTHEEYDQDRWKQRH
jgi:mRNA interferase HigB